MQKWEYCAIGPIKEALHGWVGYYPAICSFTTNGLKSSSITSDRNGHGEEDNIAIFITKLGEEGWEMVGCGGVAESDIRAHHYLYFKRPKE